MSTKRSENARAVARDVQEKVGKSMPVIMGEIVRKRGYKKSVQHSPQSVTKTKSYQEEMLPFVRNMTTERDRLITAMSKRNLTKVEYEKLARTLDILTKNIQLLTGGRIGEESIIFNDAQINIIARRAVASS